MTSSSSAQIYLQRFGATGAFYGIPTLVASGQVNTPVIASFTGGRAIVAWQQNTGSDIYGRFISSSGFPVGSAVRLNSYQPAVQSAPAIARVIDVGGDSDRYDYFVVSWTSLNQLAGNGYDVVARLFQLDTRTNTFAPIGDDFIVNLGQTLGTQESSRVSGSQTVGVFALLWGSGGSPFPVWGKTYSLSFTATNASINTSTSPVNVLSSSLAWRYDLIGAPTIPFNPASANCFDNSGFCANCCTNFGSAAISSTNCFAASGLLAISVAVFSMTA